MRESVTPPNMKLDIYLYHHRHGVDVIPVLRDANKPPMDVDLLVATYGDQIDFELDREDEYVELHQSELHIPGKLDTDYHLPNIEWS